MSRPDITVSIVSHRQNAMVNRLLADMNRYCAERVTLILTENAGDPVPLQTQECACPSHVVVNRMPKGFGANHNAAFQLCRSFELVKTIKLEALPLDEIAFAT